MALRGANVFLFQDGLALPITVPLIFEVIGMWSARLLRNTLGGLMPISCRSRCAALIISAGLGISLGLATPAFALDAAPAADAAEIIQSGEMPTPSGTSDSVRSEDSDAAAPDVSESTGESASSAKTDVSASLDSSMEDEPTRSDGSAADEEEGVAPNAPDSAPQITNANAADSSSADGLGSLESGSESVQIESKHGWTKSDSGWLYFDESSSEAHKGWLVTADSWDGTSGELRRYWLDANTGLLTFSQLIDAADSGWWAYATNGGYVVRGKYVDPTTGYVYFGDNDGRLLDPGWHVTDAYTGRLERYYIDGHLHAAKPGFSSDGWNHYTTSQGYVLRGALDTGKGRVYLADNDGRVTSTVGWLVTNAYTGAELQRYYIDALTHAAVTSDFQVDGSYYFGLGGSRGYVLRGFSVDNGAKRYADNDGRIKDGWVVTDAFGQGLQRYWQQGGSVVVDRLVQIGADSWAYARPEGYVVRGKWDNGRARVYVADNDGNLMAGTGWVVTAKYDGALRRYYIDALTHAAVTSDFQVDGSYYFGLGGSRGYVLRGFSVDNGAKRYADNDGRIKDGWVVTDAFGQGLQRYWQQGGSVVVDRLVQIGADSWAYARPEGYVVRGKWDNGRARVYVADNDGNLMAGTGWVVTAKYDGALQRYYIDSESHAAVTSFFGVEGKEYYGIGGQGYVLRNAAIKTDGKWYGADNDGWLHYLTTGKMGYQNPEGFYQVSANTVILPGYASGYFTYVSPSVISADATRDQVVEAFIQRAYEYLGTPYKWNYSSRPGDGVDCIGLVYQCAYAVGMNMGEFNPYDHYASGASGWHSHDANNMWDYGAVQHLNLSQRLRGDVISWNGHVAIYLGGDQIIEAAGSDVHITWLWRYGTPRGVLRFFQ